MIDVPRNIPIQLFRGVLELETTINQFIDRLESNRSLRPLYRSTNFRVAIKSGRDRFLLFFNKEGCRIMDFTEQAEVVISGGERELLRLVEGEERLLEMAGRQDIVAQGFYRNLLKLESLFVLNAREKYLIYQLS